MLLGNLLKIYYKQTQPGRQGGCSAGPGLTHEKLDKGYSAENMAVVRHLALNALKANPEPISLARKKRRCSYDDIFLADIIHSFHA